MYDFTLYHAAIAADDAWGQALAKAYGKHAGDARYDQRGVSTKELADLCAAKKTADSAMLDYNKKMREKE
jgi:hypothetical protein